MIFDERNLRRIVFEEIILEELRFPRRNSRICKNHRRQSQDIEDSFIEKNRLSRLRAFLRFRRKIIEEKRGYDDNRFSSAIFITIFEKSQNIEDYFPEKDR